MLDAALASQLRTHFSKITRPLQLVASLDESSRSVEMRQLLNEIAASADLISFTEDGDDARRPSFSVSSAETGDRVRFAGLPLGHEFTSLILVILQVGGHPSTAAPELIDRVKALPGPLTFETFFSQSCQNCPDVVQALNLISVLNPNVTHVAIDGAAFQDEADARQILAVPTVFLNGEPFGQGRMTLEEIVDKLDVGSNEKRAAELSARKPYDVLIIGGGPAGVSAGIYAARKGLRTAVVAERVGGQVLDTASIENLISVPGTDGPHLATALEQHLADYEVDLITRERAAHLTPAEKLGGLAQVEMESGATLKGRTVVIATGARWRQMNVPGEAEHRNKGVTYCPHCDGPLFKGKRVAVIGGGNSGVEAAIDLAGITAHVTLIEFDTQLRADAVLQRKLASLPNTTVVLNALTTQVIGDGQKMTGLVYEDRATAEVQNLDVEGVFVQIGLLPNSEWLRGSLELSDRGEVVIDERGLTSMPGIFAAGDCTTVPFKQIVIALGAGSTAALSSFDHLIRTTAPEASSDQEDLAEMAQV